MMKAVFCLLILLLAGASLRAQYVYTINADSVKITNHCDTAELIIENHTQNVPGFLYNKGRGRTEFRRGLVKLNDTTFLVGGDTLKTFSPSTAWLINGNTGTQPSIHFLGTLDTAALVFRTSNAERMRLAGSSGNLLIGGTADNGNKLQVFGSSYIRDNLEMPNLTSTNGGATGAITVGGAPFIHSGSPHATFSTYLGYKAGLVAYTSSSPVQSVVAIGHTAFQNYANGNFRGVVIGTAAFPVLVSGAGNIGIGWAAGLNSDTLNNTVILGSSAGTDIKRSANSTLIGQGAGGSDISHPSGFGSATINNSTMIGQGAGMNAPAVDFENDILLGNATNKATFSGMLNNTTIIGNGITTDLNNVALLGRTDQNVILGANASTVDNGKRLQVKGSESIDDKLYFPYSDTSGKSAIYKGTDVFMSSYNGNHTYPPAANSFDNSVYIGRGSGNFNNNSIGFNTGVGYQVLQNFTTGYNNSAYGIWSLQTLTTGVNNTGGSPYTLKRLTTGNENTALGTAALTTLSVGGQNTALGTYAGASNDTGNLNVFIGFRAGYNETGSNKLYICNSYTSTPLIYGDFSTSQLTFNGGVAVTNKTFLGGNTAPTATLHLAAGSAAAGTAPIKLTAGTVMATPEDGAIEFDGTDIYLTQSSTRYKLSKTLAGQLTTSFGSASVTAANTVTTTISVPGAQPGDVVAVSANSGAVNPPSVIITAYVTTADSVTLQAYNSSGSTIILASDTYKVRVIR